MVPSSEPVKQVFELAHQSMQLTPFSCPCRVQCQGGGEDLSGTREGTPETNGGEGRGGERSRAEEEGGGGRKSRKEDGRTGGGQGSKAVGSTSQSQKKRDRKNRNDCKDRKDRIVSAVYD